MNMDRIVKFSHLLRSNGIPASIRSTQTACQVVERFHFKDSQLQDALAAVYVKDQGQREKFNKLYDDFFYEKKKPLPEEVPKNTKPVKSVVEFPNEGKIQYQFSFKEDPQGELKAVERESTELDYQPPLEEYLDLDEKQDLLHQDISTLNSFQPQLFQVCQELGRKIATLRSRRMRQSQKLQPDVRRTIRKNLKNGGTLLELVKTRPRIKGGHYYFLCDVSGSCDWISNWFFCLVYAAQNSFRRVRVFDFDNKVVETTSALGEIGLLDAFTRVREMHQKNLMIHGTSNMYQAFRDFQDRVPLNGRSNLIILSDCRDWAGPKEDGQPLSASVIREMSRKSRRVLIFNPEEEKKWDVVDSCVSLYREAGAQVHEVRNLEQMAQMVSVI